MLRLKSDLLRRCWPRPRAGSAASTLEWSDEPALCVVMAAKGYPGAYAKGSEIRGLDAAASDPDVQIFHAGTRRDGARILADGGRVLGVTALGRDSREAQATRLRRGRQDRLAGRLLPPRHRLARGKAGLSRLGLFIIPFVRLIAAAADRPQIHMRPSDGDPHGA